MDRADVALAPRLDALPLISERLLTGRLPLASARRLQTALSRARRTWAARTG